MKKEFVAGYLYPASWKKPGDPIYSDWYKKEYADEVKANPPEELLDVKPGKYKLVITYPLSTNFTKKFEIPEKGITRQELNDICAAAYHEVYEDVAGENRYGIWGHSIYDLTICTFHFDGDLLTLGVDS